MDAREPLALAPLRSRIVCRVDAELEPPLEWAPTAAGQRRVIAVTLEAGPGDYAWVNRALFVAVAARGPASVVYALHQIL